MSYLPPEHKCAICGRVFISSSEWVYRRNGLWFCRYNHLLEYDRRMKKASEGTRLRAGQRQEIAEMLMSGMDPRQIADKYGTTIQAIWYYRQKAEA